MKEKKPDSVDVRRKYTLYVPTFNFRGKQWWTPITEPKFREDIQRVDDVYREYSSLTDLAKDIRGPYDRNRHICVTNFSRTQPFQEGLLEDRAYGLFVWHQAEREIFRRELPSEYKPAYTFESFDEVSGVGGLKEQIKYYLHEGVPEYWLHPVIRLNPEEEIKKLMDEKADRILGESE